MTRESEIAVDVVVRLQQKTSIGPPPVLREAIFVCVNGSSGGVEFGGGPHDPYGDFRPVGGHNVGEGWDVARELVVAVVGRVGCVRGS